MFNCYRVFMGSRPFAVVKNEQAAENMINLMKWYSQAMQEQEPIMSYEGAYIPDVGF